MYYKGYKIRKGRFGYFAEPIEQENNVNEDRWGNCMTMDSEVAVKAWIDERENEDTSMLKSYVVYAAGSEKVTTILETSIYEACVKFIQMLDKNAAYKVEQKDFAIIRYNNNSSICSDFMVMRA